MSIGRADQLRTLAAAIQAEPETCSNPRTVTGVSPEQGCRSRMLMRASIGLVAVAAVYASSYALLWRFNTQSGQVEGPTSPSVPQPSYIGENDAIGQFNIRHNAEGTLSSIERLFTKHKVGVLVVQEATGKDVSLLRKRIPYMYHTNVKTDGNQRLLDGGSGLHIISAQRPTEIFTRSINGTGLLAGMLGMPVRGVTSILEGESFAAAGDARQETRAAVGITVPLGVGENRFRAQIFTSHLAGRGVDAALHNRQRPRLIDFVKNAQANDARVVLIGDLNSGDHETATIARQLGHTNAVTGPTHVDGKQTPDRVTYRAFQPGTAKVVKTKGSDHNALVFRFNDR